MKRISKARKKKNKDLPVPAAVPPETTTPAIIESPVITESREEPRDPITAYRWGWYGLSVLVPFAGIFIGLFFYDQDSREARKVGRNSLFIGFLIWVAFPLLVLLAFALVGSMTILSVVADMIPPMD
jgi:Na+/proline symporter